MYCSTSLSEAGRVKGYKKTSSQKWDIQCGSGIIWLFIWGLITGTVFAGKAIFNSLDKLLFNTAFIETIFIADLRELTLPIIKYTCLNNW